MVNTKLTRKFDAACWKTGNAMVVTIPSTVVRKFKLKSGDSVEITIEK